MASALTEMAKARPYATAVAAPAGRDRAGRRVYAHWTFRDLDRESDLLAAGLTAVGVGRGVRTALMVKPGLEFFALTFGLFKAGAVPVLIDPGMGVRSLGRCLAEAAPAAFIGIPAAQAARRLLGWAKASVRTAVTVKPVRAGAPVPARTPKRGRVERLTLAQVRDAGWNVDPFIPPTTLADDLAAVLFTSGSTGPPKGVEYTHAIFDAQVRLLRETYAIEPGEVDLCTFPLFALFAPALGMTSVVPEMDFTRPACVDPENILGPVENFGVTNLFGSPALLDRVGAFGAGRGATLPSLRRVVSAGAPVPARVLERFATMLAPGVQIYTPYGATESLPVASIGSEEVLGETRQATDRGAGVCVGRPVAGMKVEVIRIDDGPIDFWSDDLRVPDGDVGEFVVDGPVVTSRYFRRPEATRLAKISAAEDPARSTHRMGDVGYRDGSGRLWFCGRKAHRVVTQDGTLFTIPVEAVFNTQPDVRRTALVGVGPRGSARPVLCVEPARWPLSKVDRDRLTAELRAIGAGFAHTAGIDVFLFHKRFPVDARHNAKIFREKLAVWAGRRV